MSTVLLPIDRDGARFDLSQAELTLPEAWLALAAPYLGRRIGLVTGGDEPVLDSVGRLHALRAHEALFVATFSRIDRLTEVVALNRPVTMPTPIADEDFASLVERGGALSMEFPQFLGFGEAEPPSFLLDHADARVLDAYGHRCALTGFAPAAVGMPPDRLRVVYLQPLGEGGATEPSNAVVVDATLVTALHRGAITFADDYRMLVAALPVESIAPLNADGKLHLPARREDWPSVDALRFHRARFAGP